jgi:predicted enzyme related to lactoylglutathione lyase
VPFNAKEKTVTTTSTKSATTSSPVGYDGGLTCSIQVADIEQSIKWYSDVLGFKELYHIKEMGWCELATEIKGVNVGLSQVENPAKLSGTKLTFGVRNIDAARKLLEQKKVRFDGPTQEIPGMVKLATFFDPTGNALMFYQDLQKA